MSFTRGVYKPLPEPFFWIQGEDYLDGSAFNCGANGVITGLGNVWIKPYIKMYQAAKAKNNLRVNEMQKEIDNLYELIQVTGGKVIPAIKAAVTLLGRSTQWMKVFSLTLGKGDIEKVKRVIIKLGLLSYK